MHLHEEKELFREVIISTAETLGLVVPIVEKDYYVTQILKQLAKERPDCVFKGGTSLSKCHHILERFSEDVNVAFSEQTPREMVRQLENHTIAGISKDLGMPIVDWKESRSRSDYHFYTFTYEPMEGYVPEGRLILGVKLEVSPDLPAFPSVQLPVDSYAYQFLSKRNMDIVEEYELQPFSMSIQGIDRTLVDKIFALCDCYLRGKMTRQSRHIYDIYKLLPSVPQDEAFKVLVRQVRALRADLGTFPSALPGVNIPTLLTEILDRNVLKADYQEFTTYFQKYPVDYEEAVTALREIIAGGMFEE